MSVPDLKHIVQKVYARGGFTLSTLEGCGEFTRACAREVRKVDERFMLLRKKASRTHVVDSLVDLRLGVLPSGTDGIPLRVSLTSHL